MFRIEFTNEEAAQLMQVLDVGVRNGGINAGVIATAWIGKIQRAGALQTAQPEAEGAAVKAPSRAERRRAAKGK